MVWFTMVTVPLQMASITKYQAGTSILRLEIYLYTHDDNHSIPS